MALYLGREHQEVQSAGAARRQLAGAETGVKGSKKSVSICAAARQDAGLPPARAFCCEEHKKIKGAVPAPETAGIPRPLTTVIGIQVANSFFTVAAPLPTLSTAFCNCSFETPRCLITKSTSLWAGSDFQVVV